MGGARCTYRNCSVRTDGKIHMFHYPVFDKVRCHQWLTNAQRLDFLNLKVSQLRNRVVCQHHFKPECFMNYKMDKLKYDVVPTENGPFCNVEELTNKVEALPICPDEIDNERSLTYKEKKANFSVKYGDFLINSEMDTDKLALITQQAILEENEMQNQPYTESKSFPITNCVKIEVPQKSQHGNMTLITTAHKPQVKNKVRIISEKKISTPVEMKGKLRPVPANLVIGPRSSRPQPAEPVKVGENIENIDVFHNQNENMVDLTNSEITFYPQTVIDPQQIHDVNMNNTQPIDFPPVNQSYDPSEALAHLQILNTQAVSDSSQIIPQLGYYPIESTPLKNKNSENNKQSNRSSPKSLLKNRIPPERVAAIEEKRKFNKKLRDMIEFCLDDNPEKTTKENSLLKNKAQKGEQELDTLKIIEELKKPMEVKRMTSQVKDIVNESSKKRVSNFLSEQPNLPNVYEYNLASIEARLKRMEENLSSRIEQNTQKIGELKGLIQATPVQKKSIMIQCKEDEDTCKKQLFQEMSQYLSPETNSLIYEELFLNKYSKKPLQKAAGCSLPTKRRKVL